jgi:CO dehydrogenase/acetyl-CoA synthase beta subunit
MELFAETIRDLRSFLETRPGKKRFMSDPSKPWPDSSGRGIVLKEDMGLELGSPEKASFSSLLWTSDPSLVAGDMITLLGPDFPESMGQSLPFGKVLLLGVEGFSEDNAYDRHKELDFLRYDLDLKGFMMRAVSQYMKEWCRIDRAALRDGFSSRVMGSELVRLFTKKPFVKSAEVIFVTSSTGDVDMLKDIVSPAERIIAAMNKMATEMDFECGTCDYREVCDDASELKSMRDKLMQKSREAGHG